MLLILIAEWIKKIRVGTSGNEVGQSPTHLRRSCRTGTVYPDLDTYCGEGDNTFFPYESGPTELVFWDK